MPDRAPPAIGETICGKYVVDSVLGRGGMGVVYRARHAITGRRVAVKWMQPRPEDSAETMARFVREARAMGRIEHPNVVQVIDIGTEDDVGYLVMELLAGEPLRKLMETSSRLPPSRAVQLLIPAMQGVHAAHRAGVIHRDLKPENLFVARDVDGRGETTKVLDFGISKLRDDAFGNAGPLTQTGTLMGTPTYMSPEQVRGSREMDARVDVWALGTILYEMLTGTVPFQADTFGALMVAIVTEAFAPIDRVVPGVPLGLVAAVHRALEKDPAHRFPDVATFAQAIERFGPPGTRFVAAEGVRSVPPPDSDRPLELAAVGLSRGAAVHESPTRAVAQSDDPRGKETRSDRPVKSGSPGTSSRSAVSPRDNDSLVSSSDRFPARAPTAARGAWIAAIAVVVAMVGIGWIVASAKTAQEGQGTHGAMSRTTNAAVATGAPLRQPAPVAPSVAPVAPQNAVILGVTELDAGPPGLAHGRGESRVGRDLRDSDRNGRDGRDGPRPAPGVGERGAAPPTKRATPGRSGTLSADEF